MSELGSRSVVLLGSTFVCFLICLEWPITQPNFTAPGSRLFQGPLSPYVHSNLFSQLHLLCSVNKNLSSFLSSLPALWPLLYSWSWVFSSPFRLHLQDLVALIWISPSSAPLSFQLLLFTTSRVLDQFSYWLLLLLEPVIAGVMKDSTRINKLSW